MRKLTIAIDGYASTGKSSIARKLAAKYSYIYINSGSMYRAVTLYVIQNNLLSLVKSDIDLLIKKLSSVSISFNFDQNNLIPKIFMNGTNIEKEIYSLHVSELVSEIAAIPQIRTEMVKLQRNIDRNLGVVMDGRDIGSVVFPDADIKLFLTASDLVRANRRFKQMTLNGECVQFKSVLKNIKNRDDLDSSRSNSPLKIEDEAFVIDNSNMTINEQLDYISKIISQKLGIN
tara:strand:+ start:9369 stop:10061 length:693 start_codon:yes stop_codon:yes gene_type:complete